MRPRVLLRLLTIEPLRALGRNKLRSALAILGISVAVATVITVVALGRASVRAAEEDLDKLGDNLVWIEAGSRNVGGVRTGSHGMTTLTARDAQAIRDEIPLVAAVSENVDGGLQAIHLDHNWNTRFRGVAPEYLTIKRWQIAAGAFFTADQLEHFERVVVIGETVRRELFGPEPAIGEQIRLQGVWFEVIGVLAAKGQSVSGQDQDDTVMMPWTTAQKQIVGKDVTWLDDILCSAVSSAAIKPAGEQIAELLRERHRINPGEDDDFNIRHPEELLAARIKTSRTLELLLLSIASISMIVGGIGVMNVMLASVSQRIREIGLRAAVGASPAAIQLQFLAEAVMLTVLGGTIGLALSRFGARISEDNFGWSLTIPTEIYVGAIVAAAAVGILFGLYPAVRAARLDPIEALRNE